MEVDMKDGPLAQNVRLLREIRHWTQEELALRSDIDVRTIQRAEGGHRLLLESRRALATAFGITVNALSTSPQDRKWSPKEFRKNYSLVELQPLNGSSHLSNIAGAHALQLQKVGDLSDAQANAVAELEEALRDAGDLWSDLGPIQQRETEKIVQKKIDQVCSLEVAVSFGLETAKLRPRTGEDTVRWRILHVATVRGQVPLRYLLRDKRTPFSL